MIEIMQVAWSNNVQTETRATSIQITFYIKNIYPHSWEALLGALQ